MHGPVYSTEQWSALWETNWAERRHSGREHPLRERHQGYVLNTPESRHNRHSDHGILLIGDFAVIGTYETAFLEDIASSYRAL